MVTADDFLIASCARKIDFFAGFKGPPNRLRLQSVRSVLAGVYPPPILKPTILKGRERRRGARPRHIPLPTEEGIFLAGAEKAEIGPAIS